ncbi:cuticle protein AM1199-like [Macrobrachium nipponense]|uniref:cuticle protein AM1199-like n=1 Tax=Macrobrachium nipponense TaxID=159736 RepID=UPI0030C7E61D
MLFVVLSCFVALACGAPQFAGRPIQYNPNDVPQYRHIAILKDERVDHGDGNFQYAFETENGINVNAVGTPGSKGQSNIQGAFSFPLPDGTLAQVRYIADEFGFRAESPLIPTPHPLPAHAIEQIRIAEQQRAQGIVWE